MGFEKKGKINKDALKNAIHSQKQWSVEQAQKAFETDSIEELIIIMEYMGYNYSENEKLFSEKEYFDL